MKEKQPDRGEWEELRPYREVKERKKQTRTDKISRDRSRIGERGRRLEEPDDRPSELTHVPTVAAALLLLLRFGGLMLALY